MSVPSLGDERLHIQILDRLKGLAETLSVSGNSLVRSSRCSKDTKTYRCSTGEPHESTGLPEALSRREWRLLSSWGGASIGRIFGPAVQWNSQHHTLH